MTRLMGTIEMNPETRGDVAGTEIRVTVAAQSEVFVPTQDPVELSLKKAELVEELADNAIRAVSEIGRKDSAHQKMMQEMLSGQLHGTNLKKAPGIKDLVVSGYAGDQAVRIAEASMALGEFVRKGDGGFSPLEEIPDPTSDESDDDVQGYVDKNDFCQADSGE